MFSGNGFETRAKTAMAQIAPEILLTGAIWATHRGNLGHLKMLSWDTKNHLNNDKISQIMYIKLSISIHKIVRLTL